MTERRERADASATFEIALVGNPNCGKTTLFNALTGARQRVGNWPGVTVERKTGSYRHAGHAFDVVDLPGAYSVADADSGEALDERITRDYLKRNQARVVVNVVDASSLSRGLYLTTQLLELGTPVVVALNMIDVAGRHGMRADAPALASALGCPVVPLVASRRKGVRALQDAVARVAVRPATQEAPPKQAAGRTRAGPVDAGPLPHAVPAPAPNPAPGSQASVDRYRRIDGLMAHVVRADPVRRTVTDLIDAVVLNRVLAFPVFLAVIYLMFMFTINVGSAFIDFFNIVGAALFVDGPRAVYEWLGLPGWLTALLADGVGGGVQLVGTFIPVIACLFLFLSFLEGSGYMGRVAFVLDRVMQRVGLPGKSFVPLIVGFGCNVPAVMATRSLDREPDRILTAIMAPYMSCGARLTVYALFVAAFFPSNGQNLVFALYLIGIAIAVLSALAVRRYVLQSPVSTFVIELPPYHLPTVRGILIHSWQRLKGFVLRAGKAIVLVVIVLNVVNSIGTDGSFGNENQEKSVLSEIGRTITPAFHPMGIDEDNWPATVGIFTGIFAKEVVVGTLDALYAVQLPDPAPFDLGRELGEAWSTIGDNLGSLGEAVTDPLGMDVGNVADTAAAASEQQVEITTIQAMRGLFHGELGAFSYLLFILLYMPCVATIGVIYKEIGAGWAVFSTAWSVATAYGAAVLCYQIGSFAAHPTSSTLWIVAIASLTCAAFCGLIAFGRRHMGKPGLIPVTQIS